MDRTDGEQLYPQIHPTSSNSATDLWSTLDRKLEVALLKKQASPDSTSVQHDPILTSLAKVVHEICIGRIAHIIHGSSDYRV